MLAGIRGIGAIAIAVYHITRYPPLAQAADSVTPDIVRAMTSHGWMAVQWFFVISGFGIAYATLSPPPSARAIWIYFVRRTIRLAYRLQTSAPELMDLKTESKETLEMYGCDPDKPSFARACLLARRMIERGVRFVNIYHEGWDAHSDVTGNLKGNCGATDKASAALVKDLKQRGLLDETLVIWGGEFGRTPMVETNVALGRSRGRDHHPQAFTIWLAGGGIKSGLSYGSTDELGFHVVEQEVHVHDLQATVLHCLGFDHERLTYTYQGRQFRLTDFHGKVVKAILA